MLFVENVGFIGLQKHFSLLIKGICCVVELMLQTLALVGNDVIQCANQ